MGGRCGLAQWADLESDDAAPDMWEELPASRESLRRAALGAEGWMGGPDKRWRKSFDGAELMPKCEVGCVVHAAVRDRSPGVTIHDTAGSAHFDTSRLS